MSLPAGDAASARIGEAVTLRATLRPPPEPVEPGGFDFGRQAWFDAARRHRLRHGKIAAARGAHRPRHGTCAAWAQVDASAPRSMPASGPRLPGETGEIAAALITGERAGISEEATRPCAIRPGPHPLDLGPAHGHHGGHRVLAGRALLALVPVLALRYPIRKWAAAVGACRGHRSISLLSGAAVPTVRSWIMMSIVLIAVHARPAGAHHAQRRAGGARHSDRRAGEPVRPELPNVLCRGDRARRALSSGSPRAERRSLHDVSPVWAALRQARASCGGAAVTTLVASAAIAPFAVYHFHRMTHFGVIANLVAVPLVSLLIMPMALVEPAGHAVRSRSLAAARSWDLASTLMVATGSWVASWPGAVSVLPSISGAALSAHGPWRVMALPVADALASARPGDRCGRARARAAGPSAPTC